MVDDDTRAYRVKQVAEMLGTSTGTVRGWIRSGRLRAKQPSRLILIPAAELDRFIRDAPDYQPRAA